MPLKRWQEAAFASHPLLAAQEAQVRQAESTLGAERQAWVPDVTVKAFHVRDVDLKATGGGLSIPLPLWNRKEGEVAKAAAAKSQADSELRLLKQDLETKLASQYSLYETARRQVESFQTAILKEAAESLRVAQFSYEHGETSLLELLDSRRVYRGTEQDYYKALLDYQSGPGGTLAIGRWRCQVMRVRLSWTRWLVIMVVTLSAAGLLGGGISTSGTSTTNMLITTMPNMLKPKNPSRHRPAR